MTPKVQTVAGDVNPEALGRTLTHEHLFMEFSHFYRRPPPQLEDKFHLPPSMNTVGYRLVSDLYEVLHQDEWYEFAVAARLALVCRPVVARLPLVRDGPRPRTHTTHPDEGPRIGPKLVGTYTDYAYIRQYPYSSKDNLLLNDDDAKAAVMYDVLAYKKFGGGTIVENTSHGIHRDVNFYKHVSQQSGVHIVAGTGYYIADVQSSQAASVEEIHNHMLKELTEGCAECADVKAGFMGEIASVWPIKDFERRVIQAVGELQEQTGFGVSFHPHREPAAPTEIIRLYLEAGGRPEKAVMSHLDRTLLDSEKLLEFSSLGTYCQFDLFGVEVSLYQLHEPTAMPSDAQRIDMVALLLDEGKGDRILMSHDIHTKHRLIDFGGHGYSHIINNVLPRMKVRGIPQETIDKITITNPATWLTIDN